MSPSSFLFQLAVAGPVGAFFPVYFAANCKEGISKDLGREKALFNVVYPFGRRKCPQAWLV